MKKTKEYMEKIYEEFSEDIKPTEEMKIVYRDFSNKILKFREKLNKEQTEEFDDIEDLFSELNYLEVKQAFLKGFSVAVNISSENLE